MGDPAINKPCILDGKSPDVYDKLVVVSAYRSKHHPIVCWGKHVLHPGKSSLNDPSGKRPRCFCFNFPYKQPVTRNATRRSWRWSTFDCCQNCCLLVHIVDDCWCSLLIVAAYGCFMGSARFSVLVAWSPLDHRCCCRCRYRCCCLSLWCFLLKDYIVIIYITHVIKAW